MKEIKLFQNIPQNIVGRKINFVSSVGYAFALLRVRLRVLSKGMVSFHLKLKALRKYLNTNKNIKVLRVHFNCMRIIAFKRNECK